MRDRHGYLERLLDDFRDRGDRKARAPHQISWVSTPAVADGIEHETLVEPSAHRPTSRMIRGEAVPTQSAMASTPEPGPNPAQSQRLRRAVAAPPMPAHEPAIQTPRSRQEARPVPAALPSLEPPHAPRRAPGAITEPPFAPAAPPSTPAAPAPAPPDGPFPQVLPPAALRAFERLLKLSRAPVHAAQEGKQAPAAAAPAALAPPPRQHAPERPPATVVTARRRRDEPARPPAVHIGSIEVTVTSPPPAPAPATAAPAPPAPVASPPLGRLSRPNAVFGFGQA